MRFLPALATAATLALPVTASAQQSPTDANPCLDTATYADLLCPDLIMHPPSDLRVDRRTRPGRVLLRATNWIENIGTGPVELRGIRDGARTMSAHQAIKRRVLVPLRLPPSARLYFFPIPGQYRYWKFRDAARFELWSTYKNGQARRLVRHGPKQYYCLRDLRRTHPSSISPRRFVYAGCNQNPNARRVTLGTSPGWADIYPASYHQQWIDVTGLRGRFLYRQIVDPKNHIAESNETNNVGEVYVNLPYRGNVRNRSPFYSTSRSR
ncbi:MAG TPA: lysyl oxidase family protein [Thermoleophilaceae bacterium]